MIYIDSIYMRLIIFDYLYYSHKFKFIQFLVILFDMEIWLKTESLSMSQLTVDGFLSTVSRGHLNSFSAMDFYSPQPQELQLLLSLARLAVQARPDSLFFSCSYCVMCCRYCTYFYGWQILQVILLPHSSDFKHLICYPCSPCSTFIHMLHL